MAKPIQMNLFIMENKSGREEYLVAGNWTQAIDYAVGHNGIGFLKSLTRVGLCMVDEKVIEIGRAEIEESKP